MAQRFEYYCPYDASGSCSVDLSFIIDMFMARVDAGSSCVVTTKWKERFKTNTKGISPAMACAEYLELEHEYASAVRRWAQYAHPQNIVPPGADQLQRAAALRRDALAERNAAADTLHLHRQHCMMCKRQGAA
jgi:hypothetical protein